jgi:hypothetical protein
MDLNLLVLFCEDTCSSMLKYYIEEVQAVAPVEDDIEPTEVLFETASDLTPRVREDTPPSL